ncbi:hypothetical protein KCU93_g365, partial [Aureobasidium melanogenum]
MTCIVAEDNLIQRERASRNLVESLPLCRETSCSGWTFMSACWANQHILLLLQAAKSQHCPSRYFRGARDTVKL